MGGPALVASAAPRSRRLGSAMPQRPRRPRARERKRERERGCVYIYIYIYIYHIYIYIYVLYEYITYVSLKTMIAQSWRSASVQEASSLHGGSPILYSLFSGVATLYIYIIYVGCYISMGCFISIGCYMSIF